MKILMFTNTYRPHVSGVSRSIYLFRNALTNRGHTVRIIAPFFTNMKPEDDGVIRIHAFTNFNGSGFSLPLPAPETILRMARAFGPHVIHSHHPFLLGNAALICAGRLRVPLVYTYHTRYEQYTHYVPGDSPFLRRFVVLLVKAYCRRCDAVITPSLSMAQLLGALDARERRHILPTGVDETRFRRGDGNALRKREGIPEDAFVVGTVGRLALEKNIEFLSLALAKYLVQRPQAHAMVVGNGPMEAHIRNIFLAHGVAERLHMPGVLVRHHLVDAYHAMDVFAFASRSETQGLVLIEAMAAGRPVVALDGSGVREVVKDYINGRLLMIADVETFVQALLWIDSLAVHRVAHMRRAIAKTVDDFALRTSVDRLVEIYASMVAKRANSQGRYLQTWRDTFAARSRIAGIYLCSAIRAIRIPPEPFISFQSH